MCCFTCHSLGEGSGTAFFLYFLLEYGCDATYLQYVQLRTANKRRNSSVCWVNRITFGTPHKHSLGPLHLGHTQPHVDSDPNTRRLGIYDGCRTGDTGHLQHPRISPMNNYEHPLLINDKIHSFRPAASLTLSFWLSAGLYSVKWAEL